MLFTFFLATAGYFYFDPFKVIHAYSNYSFLHVTTNRDYISTEMFIKNRQRYNYNSFIFGSSRTLAYDPVHWKKHLTPNDSPFMFDASGETFQGVYRKIKFLDSSRVQMKNAIVILCRDASFFPPQGGHLFIKDPRTCNDTRLSFNIAFLKAYFNPQFLLSYYTYILTGEYKPWMRGYIDNRNIKVDSITNKINILDQEEEITKTPGEYYAKRKDVFYTRSGERTDTVPRINKNYERMLEEVAAIFKRQGTNYNVIISPLYEQTKFHPDDIALLKKIFGENLFDFSGENEFTKNIHNYYEKSHYRPNVGDSILNYIYQCKAQNPAQ
ncbi:MAG: hypothetical protein ACXVPN_07685 [Bacteroidia bacterium]